MNNKKKMLAFVAICVSVLGIAFLGALKPVIVGYSLTQLTTKSIFDFQEEEIKLKMPHYTPNDRSGNKMVTMLSEVLGIEQEDIALALEGGSKPSELLHSNGILLSDLAEEYSFDIVGNGFVRFRA